MPKAFDSSIGRSVIVAQSALNERVLVEIRGGDEHDDDKRGEVRFPGEPIAAALFYSGLNHTSQNGVRNPIYRCRAGRNAYIQIRMGTSQIFLEAPCKPCVSDWLECLHLFRTDLY